MTNKKYKKLGTLFKAPIIQTTNVLAVTLLVIGMVTYVGLYNPRAGLASAKSPPNENADNARAAPASKPGDLNGDNTTRALDVSKLISSYGNNVAASMNHTFYGSPLETLMSVMKHHWSW